MERVVPLLACRYAGHAGSGTNVSTQCRVVEHSRQTDPPDSHRLSHVTEAQPWADVSLQSLPTPRSLFSLSTSYSEYYSRQLMISPHNNDHRIVLYYNAQYQPRKNTYQKSR